MNIFQDHFLSKEGLDERSKDFPRRLMLSLFVFALLEFLIIFFDKIEDLYGSSTNNKRIYSWFTK